MDDFSAMRIASDGMRAQRVRIQLISENLANQNTTGPNGPYQRKEAIFRTVPVPSFQASLDSALNAVSDSAESRVMQSVSVSGVHSDGAEPLMRFEPGHPDADADGYVAYPNISVIREMTDMMEANRSYEANLAVSKTTTDMINKALDLLG